jgi:hypothetical protein
MDLYVGFSLQATSGQIRALLFCNSSQPEGGALLTITGQIIMLPAIK